MIKEIDGVNYRLDSKGSWVPESSIKPQDLLKDEFVEDAAEKILTLRKEMVDVHTEIKNGINAYLDLIFEKYGVTPKGQKGNLSLTSLDGNTRITISMSESLYLDEGVIAAKELIDEYLEDAIKDAGVEIRQLVTSAFRVKQGSLDVKSILRLRSLNISDERWKKAMDIIGEAIVVRNAKSSLRLYKRTEGGFMEYVPLDFSVIA